MRDLLNRKKVNKTLRKEDRRQITTDAGESNFSFLCALPMQTLHGRDFCKMLEKGSVASRSHHLISHLPNTATH